MAKVISKPSALRREYILLIKRLKRALLFGAVFIATAITGSIIMNNDRLFSSGLAVLGVSALGFIISVIIAAMRHTDATVIKAGIDGENATAHIVSALPDDYSVFLNLTVEYGGKQSELDTVVVADAVESRIQTELCKHYGIIVTHCAHVQFRCDTVFCIELEQEIGKVALEDFAFFLGNGLTTSALCKHRFGICLFCDGIYRLQGYVRRRRTHFNKGL